MAQNNNLIKKKRPNGMLNCLTKGLSLQVFASILIVA
jgi:hypothetical protein